MTPCPSLSDLPNELLLLIAAYCSQDAIAHLTRVNHRLHRLLLPILYRAPRLITPERFRAFVQDAAGRHGLLVHELEFSHLRYRWDVVDDANLHTLLKACPNLTLLDLDSTAIRHEGFRMVGSSVGPRLRTLGLSDSALTDASLIYLAERCGELRKLDLSITDISSVGLRAIANGCPHLRWVSLRDCPGISDASIRALKSHCRGLRHLDVNCCGRDESGISDWDWETDGVYTGDEGTDELTWDEADGGRWVVRGQDQAQTAPGWVSSDGEDVNEEDGWGNELGGEVGALGALPDMMVPPTMPDVWPVHFPNDQDMAEVTGGAEESGSDADWETEEEEV